MRHLSTLLAVLLILGLSGCAGDMSDLERYAREVKARPGGRIEPVPELKPYQSFVYPGHERNPFDAGIFATRVIEDDPTAPAVAGIRPDQYRTREFLESFPLDTLRMVGTLTRDEDFYVLIRTPDRSIQRVSLGNYMGQNHGRITGISQTGVELMEIVPDGHGGYMERETTIALSE
ncbi:pilus assembly protein PilP [Thiorhodospira sibirica]|uniref:pilus assembly protein PilP n=1 Tax=Thiorhodospira sibirica TaxID=154347 RepID=UPI00022C112C|nr:pilus assembly protein PilP [Thiorhodospira sibirica]